MTAIHFREASAADRDAILALRAISFPDDDAEKRRPDFWEWEFSQGYAGAGRIFVAEASGAIVAHFAFVPQRYYAGHSIDGALAVDVMTHPAYRRQKVFSRLSAFAAEHLKKDFQVVLAFQIRGAVLPGMTAGGWQVAESLPVLLKPLSLLALARDFGLPVRDRAASSEISDPSIRPLDPAYFDHLDRLLASDCVRQQRSPEFVRWRYFGNPAWRYEADGYFEGDALRAFAIYRQSRLRGVRSVAIADIGHDGRDAEPAQKLIEHVVRKGRAWGASVAAVLVSAGHPANRALRRAGFLRGPHRFRLLTQVFDDSLSSLRKKSWSLSWGDTDHL